MQEPARSLEEEFDEDYEVLDEIAEEWTEDSADATPLSTADRMAIEREIADLEQFRQLAVSITHNAKGEALLIALDHAFAEAERLGAPRKPSFSRSRGAPRITSCACWQKAPTPMASCYSTDPTAMLARVRFSATGYSATEVPTELPVRVRPTCAPPLWTISASKARS